jgi:hypothetical protein
MKTKEIRSMVEEARTNHGFIAITRYRSNSGRISNVTLQPLGPDGYHRLISESLEQVEQGKVDKPNGVSQSVWDQAVQEQCDSWRKTLAGGHGRKDNFSKGNKAFYTHANNGDTITVRNVRIIRKDVIVEGDQPATRSKPATVAKKLLKGQTPVFFYQGSFKLDPAKFDKISFGGMTIEGNESE